MVTISGNHRTRNTQTGKHRVLDATVKVLARDGLDGLSIRRVAVEADVSIGGVQHHFESKNELLVGAAQHITDQFKTRAAQLRASTREKGARESFIAFCQLLANAEPKAENECDTTPSIVWLWYAAQATKPGSVAQTFTASWTETENYLHTMITQLFPRCDAHEEAGYLLALLDGLAVARAAEPTRMPPQRARSIIQCHFNRLTEQNGRDAQPT